MRKKRGKSGQSQIGVFCAIPVLFTLMAAAGAFYATNLLAVVSETKEANTALEEKDKFEKEARALRKRSQELEEVISVQGRRMKEMQRAREKAGETRRDQEKLDSMEKELKQVKTALKEEQSRISQLENKKNKIQDNLRDLQEAEKAFNLIQGSLKSLQAKIGALSEENQRLEEAIKTVQRAVEEKEHVQARDLVPAGSLQAAIFMECDAKGVWIMPEKNLLESEAKNASREAFLRRAGITGYVVFLIRPDGFKSFEKYREVLETYNESASSPLEFGYEPVDADWKLSYPDRKEEGI